MVLEYSRTDAMSIHIPEITSRHAVRIKALHVPMTWSDMLVTVLVQQRHVRALDRNKCKQRMQLCADISDLLGVYGRERITRTSPRNRHYYYNTPQSLSHHETGVSRHGRNQSMASPPFHPVPLTVSLRPNPGACHSTRAQQARHVSCPRSRFPQPSGRTARKVGYSRPCFWELEGSTSATSRLGCPSQPEPPQHHRHPWRKAAPHFWTEAAQERVHRQGKRPARTEAQGKGEANQDERRCGGQGCGSRHRRCKRLGARTLSGQKVVQGRS